MKRRTLLTLLSTAGFTHSLRAAKPDWQASLISGGFVGQHYRAGLRIILSAGWKTYWRVPGETGIAPQVKVTDANLESFELLLPLPKRISDENGESIGYQNEVMFLLVLKPRAANVPLATNVSAFFGVCHNICKPAQFASTLQLKPGPVGAIESETAAWWAKMPVKADFITSAMHNGTELILTLKQPLDDIFIEGPDGLYFRKPSFRQDTAVLKIEGLEPGQKLSGNSLRVTAASAAKGLEQVVIVA